MKAVEKTLIRCAYCRSDAHHVTMCPTFCERPVSARRGIPSQRTWCYSCLDRNLQRDCSKARPCPHCTGRHHPILCANRSGRAVGLINPLILGVRAGVHQLLLHRLNLNRYLEWSRGRSGAVPHPYKIMSPMWTRIREINYSPTYVHPGRFRRRLLRDRAWIRAFRLVEGPEAMCLLPSEGGDRLRPRNGTHCLGSQFSHVNARRLRPPPAGA